MAFIGTVRNIIIAQQNAEWFAARRTELLVINQVEQTALIKVRRTLNVTGDILPAGIKKPYFGIFCINERIDQKPQTAPGTLQLLISRVVNNRVDLLINQLIQHGNLLIQPATQSKVLACTTAGKIGCPDRKCFYRIRFVKKPANPQRIIN